MNTNLMQYSTEQLTQMLQAQQISPVDYQQEMQRRMAAMAQPQQAQQQVQAQTAQAAPAQPQMPAQQQMMPQMIPGQQQPGWFDQASVWMHMHPKTTIAGAMVVGGVAVTGARWGYNKFLGGDANYSEEEASAVTDAFSEIIGG